jgi:hypothetical protein
LATQIRLPGGSADCGFFGFHIREQSSWGLPLDQTYFAWWGPASPLGAAYWRVTGPMVLLEFAPQALGGDQTQHAHNMYRDPTNEYGAAWTALK